MDRAFRSPSMVNNFLDMSIVQRVDLGTAGEAPRSSTTRVQSNTGTTAERLQPGADGGLLLGADVELDTNGSGGAERGRCVLVRG